MLHHLLPRSSRLGRQMALPALALLCISSFTGEARAQNHSVAREWNDLLLESIRNDYARPTVHARNLYHVSIAMWDAWAAYDSTAVGVLTTEKPPVSTPTVDKQQKKALSFACYNILRARFASSPGAATMLPLYDQLMVAKGYDTTFTSTVGNTPEALGNRIAVNVLAYGLADHSNEAGDYVNLYYTPVNPPLLPAFPGNPNLLDPNRWQPLALDFFIDQSGNPVANGYPEFLSPEWGQVSPFSLTTADLIINPRDGFDYWIYHDPGPPPYLGTSTTDDYHWGFEMVTAWSSHLDPSDGVMWDISPGAMGNAALPSGPSEYDQFYDFSNGDDWGNGYSTNPVTGQPYPSQLVPRGDYARILAEFWADGPESETPPGHWFVILNYVSDHPSFTKKLGGQGPVLNALEWDVKAYLAMGGAMHDCAVSAWGIKGWYDYIRPVSALRHMADMGQCSDSSLPNYHPDGISLSPGLIEVVDSATTAPGGIHEHLAGSEGKIALYAWRGPDHITNPLTDEAGVGWILAEHWWPYQRPTFVTPPFAGYVSGHSTYSRAAAIVMDRLTGSPYFPDGKGEFFCPQDQFLVFEDGPSVDVTLQWASYYDASDQCSLSRIWGGIHPPADDIPGRLIGEKIGPSAFDLAVQYFDGSACDATTSIYIYGSGCAGEANLVPRLAMTGCPKVGGTVTTIISDAKPQSIALIFVGMLEANLPVAGSCTLNVLPVIASIQVPLGGTPGVPGSGELSLPSALSSGSLSGATLKLQAFVADNTNPWGYSASNGLSLSVE